VKMGESTILTDRTTPCRGRDVSGCAGRAARMRIAGGLATARGIISLLVLVPLGIGVAASPLHYAAGSDGHLVCQCAGWLLFLAGATTRWWATLYVGGRKTRDLVTEGAYSVTRNPLYLGTFLLAMSMGVLAQSATFSLGAVAVSLFYLITVLVEENNLRSLHGDRFQAYCQRVPRLLPNFRLLQSREILSVHLCGLRAELIRMCRWASIPLVCELFNHLRIEAWWPIWFELP
jgi:protein-S-isoprenylcysteine O-methyltransferase Ste14